MADVLKTEKQVAADLDSLSENAAEEAVQIVRSSVSRRGRCTVVLAGGGTPRTLYERLARMEDGRVPWNRLRFFWGDERVVSWDDERSNYRMAYESLLGQVEVPPENVHPMPVGHAQPEEAAASYEATLRRFFDSEWPRFDLVLLGIGSDGHTASLFPDTPVLDERQRWVVSVHAPAEPPQRLTMTLPVLNAAANVFVLAAGSEKARAVQRALEHPLDAHACPAGAVRPSGGRLVWWMDEAAAAYLTVGDGQ